MPRVVNVEGKVTAARDAQLEKALEPIDVTLSGTVKEVRPVPEKALFPILVTLPRKVTCVSSYT